jgi:spermidine synthase
MSRSLWTIYGLFLASGATALVYQVTWTRNLSLIFGASFEAISIVLGAFMGGLAAGGVFFGRRAAQFGRPLRLYGLLEIGVALSALALPSLVDLVHSAYLGVVLQVDGVNAAVNAMRVAMAFGVLLIPTFFMGGTLPILIRFLVHRRGELGDKLSRLYAINTFGAVIGTLTGGFVLLPLFGVWHSQLLTVGANLLIGVAALAADHFLADRDSKLSTDELSSDVATSEESHEPATTPEQEASWPFRLTFWGTAVAGMGALALEVSWSRAIAIATGANTYSFTIMLATFLVGIALGSWLHGLIPAKRILPSVQFGVVLALIGISSAVVSLIIPRLPELSLIVSFKLYGGLSGVRAATTFVISFLVMLVPCIFMGVAFPLAGEARARLRRSFEESVGDLVGLNTAGAIVGSILAGFLLIPQIGLQRTMLLASALYLGFGLIVLCAAWGAKQANRRALAWGGGLAALPVAVAIAFAFPSWDMRSMSAFPNNSVSAFVNARGEINIQPWRDRTRLLYAREGRGSTIAVAADGEFRSLLVNGKVVASNLFDDMQHEYLLGHLPMLLHPDPKNAVVVGLGAGLTLGGVAADESVERIVVVEIEPAVRGGAQIFADLHDDALSDPRVELAWQDGRNYLHTTSEKFDVITADPIHPWAQGAAYLYTTEYFSIISDRLTEDGIMCQWLPLYELGVDDLKSVVAAFVESFEHATLWQATGDALLIGSNAPIGVDLETLKRRFEQPRVARQLARAGLDEPLSFLGEYTMDRETMLEFARGATINTDDNLFLEFSSPSRIGGAGSGKNFLLINSKRRNASAVVRKFGPRFETREELEVALERIKVAKSETIELTKRWYELTAMPTKKGLQELISKLRAVLREAPDYQRARFLLANCYAHLGELHRQEGSSLEAFSMYHRSLEFDPGNAIANQHIAENLVKRGEPERATQYYERSIERKPRSIDALADAGRLLMKLERFEEALEHFRELAIIFPDHAGPQRRMCACLRELGRPEDAAEACKRADELKR